MNETRQARRFTPEEDQRIIRLRQAYYPDEIAKMLNRPEQSIHNRISLLKSKGHTFPRLPHRGLKYNNEIVNTWRSYRKPVEGKRLSYKQIAEITGYPQLSNAAMSRQMSKQLHGELIG